MAAVQGASSRKLRQLSKVGQARSGFLDLLERAHLTVSGLLLICVAAAGWVIARWQGSRTLFLMVYAGVLVIVSSYVVARRRLAVSVDRSQIPTRMREGQSSEVTLVIRADRRAT